jgi:pheromone shutdown protein TraB
MITLVGVGHVFAISDNVKELIRSKRPEVVCLELDPARYQSLVRKETSQDVPLQYMLLAKIQKRMASKFDVEVGDEMMAAATAAGEVGAKLALIDMDASSVFAKLWRKMSLKEKVGLFVGAFAGLVASKETVEREMEHYTANDAEYIEKMADGFPTIKEVLIDERNRFMADRISSLAATHGNIVAVVGDGHIPGMLEALRSHQVEAVRLKDLRAGPVKAQGGSEFSVSYWYH